MDKLGATGFGNIYELFNLIKEIPNTSIYCKNVKGVILWHNNYIVNDLKINQSNLIGKTVFDILSPESAQICLEHDLEAMNSKNKVCKQQSIRLITGETKEYFTTIMPWMVSEQVVGVIVNAINMNDTICQQFKTCYLDNQTNHILNVKLQDLYFNFKQPLKEILLLANLIILGNIDEKVKLLCEELREFAKTLLSDCDDILNSKKIINSEQVPVLFQKINLRKLIQAVFYKQMRTIKPKNTKLLLIISNQVPEIIIGDLSRTNKILQLILKGLLQVSLNITDMTVNIYCKLELLKKVSDKNIIISFIFEMENYLLKELINNDKKVQNNFKLVSSLLSDNHNDRFGFELLNRLVKELLGDIEFIDNKNNSKIAINLPFEVLNVSNEGLIDCQTL